MRLPLVLLLLIEASLPVPAKADVLRLVDGEIFGKIVGETRQAYRVKVECGRDVTLVPKDRVVSVERNHRCHAPAPPPPPPPP